MLTVSYFTMDYLNCCNKIGILVSFPFIFPTFPHIITEAVGVKCMTMFLTVWYILSFQHCIYLLISELHKLLECTQLALSLPATDSI